MGRSENNVRIDTQLISYPDKSQRMAVHFLSQEIPLPMFDYCICRINNSAVHIKKLKPRKLPSLYNHLPEATY